MGVLCYALKESTTALSPRIVDDSWGSLQIEGRGSFKDTKLWPGGAEEWHWSKTGTEHSPGIQPQDAEELINHGAKVVILTEMGGAVEVYPTEDAIKRYNEPADNQPVGALIHSTC
ncbi:MAG: hypothetical protein ACLFPV_08670 [Spirochaetaceae bacterium]